jgi:serine phosphatase RsbU (regulator of sigma subunit)
MADSPPSVQLDDSERVANLLATHPAFKVMTVDGIGWIDPFTGTVLPAPFGYEEVAREHLLATKPWTRTSPKLLAELQQLRWVLFLRERITSEPRFTILHPDGRWLNPYTGRWEVGVAVENGKFTPATLQTMATVLSGCEEAGVKPLLPPHEIERLKTEAVKSDLQPDRAQPAASALVHPPRVVSGLTARHQGVGKTSDSGRMDTTAAIVKASDSSRTHLAVAPPTTARVTADDARANEPKSDLHRAKSVMETMLHKLPVIDGYDLAVVYEPHDAIGGDFYDFIALDEGRYLITVGDVSGHGAEAALVVASALKALRHFAKPGIELVELMCMLNQDVRDDMPKGFFITMFASVLDTRRRTLTAICAGHHPGLLCSLRRPITMQQVGAKGSAIGVIKNELFRKTMVPVTVGLEAGDTFLQFTDGVFEVYNASGIEFGRLRTMGSCIANLEHPPEVMVTRMVKEVRKFASGTVADDLTFFALKVKDEQAPT